MTAEQVERAAWLLELRAYYANVRWGGLVQVERLPSGGLMTVGDPDEPDGELDWQIESFRARKLAQINEDLKELGVETRAVLEA